MLVFIFANDFYKEETPFIGGSRFDLKGKGTIPNLYTCMGEEEQTCGNPMVWAGFELGTSRSKSHHRTTGLPRRYSLRGEVYAQEINRFPCAFLIN